MDKNRPDRSDDGPADDLGPALRRAVDGILRDPPPDDVMSRALAAARRVGRHDPETEVAALRRPPRVVWRVLAVAASIGILAGVAWWRWGGSSDRQMANRPPPVGSDHVRPAVEGPEMPRGERQPSLWAYRQAAWQSAEAFDAALDRDARCLLRPDPQPAEAGVSLESTRQTL
jgi:hypothetical protein